MRIPLVGIKDAATPENQVYPALDWQSKIIFDEEDGIPSTYTAHEVKCIDKIDKTGKTEIPFWLTNIYDNWEVSVTDKRIAVRNPYVMVIFRTPKQKRGKASVGHIPFRSLFTLSATYNINGNPVLICNSNRYDGTESSVAIELTNVGEIKKLAADLHERIEKWVVDNERQMILDNDPEGVYKNAMNNWNTFIERAWEEREVTVYTPCKAWDMIADNNF